MERVKFMSNWEEYVRTVEPYVPGEQPNQPDMIKLNTNENPYPPAPGVVEALKNFDTEISSQGTTMSHCASSIRKHFS